MVHGRNVAEIGSNPECEHELGRWIRGRYREEDSSAGHAWNLGRRRLDDINLGRGGIITGLS